MDQPTYPISVGQMPRTDPEARRAEGDRWVSLRSLRNQPHVSAQFAQETPAPAAQEQPAAPAAPARPASRSLYLAVVQHHEQARRLAQAWDARSYAVAAVPAGPPPELALQAADAAEVGN